MRFEAMSCCEECGEVFKKNGKKYCCKECAAKAKSENAKALYYGYVRVKPAVPKHVSAYAYPDQSEDLPVCPFARSWLKTDFSSGMPGFGHGFAVTVRPEF